MNEDFASKIANVLQNKTPICPHCGKPITEVERIVDGYATIQTTFDWIPAKQHFEYACHYYEVKREYESAFICPNCNTKLPGDKFWELVFG